MGGDLLVSGVVQATPDKLRSSYSVMKYHKEGPACGRIPYDAASSEADCEYPLWLAIKNQDSHAPGKRSIKIRKKQFCGLTNKKRFIKMLLFGYVQAEDTYKIPFLWVWHRTITGKINRRWKRSVVPVHLSERGRLVWGLRQREWTGFGASYENTAYFGVNEKNEENSSSC